MCARQEDTTESHKYGVTGVVTDLVRRGEEHDCSGEIPEQVFLTVQATSPTQTKRRKEEREGDHADLETLARKKSEADKGQNGETERQQKTMHRAGEGNHGACPIYCV